MFYFLSLVNFHEKIYGKQMIIFRSLFQLSQHFLSYLNRIMLALIPGKINLSALMHDGITFMLYMRWLEICVCNL